MIKTTLSEFQNNFPKLISNFERTTGKNAIYRNKLTKGFLYWLGQKIKYKTLICNDPNCPKYGLEFNNKIALASHKKWHKPGYRENQSKILKGHWTGNKNPNYDKFGEEHPRYGKSHSKESREKISEVCKGRQFTEEHRRKLSEAKKGEKCYNYGKLGEENYNWKGDEATHGAKHWWINKHYPQKDICDDKCEVCGKLNLNLDLAQFIHTNKRNMDNPMIDYMYICPDKNSCHSIYDKLTDKQKEELLNGATIREEKLKRVKEYVLKIINNDKNKFTTN